MEKVVISLGGSRIIPENVDTKFLEDFRDMVYSHPKTKFVVVTGGGTTARKYISGLRKMGKGSRTLAEAGISITRFHAGIMMKIFGKGANEDLPRSMKKVENLLRRNQVVFCGALRWRDNYTTDATAASLASHLGCVFVNLTDVDGLYTANPKKSKRARFIPMISWKDFERMARKIKFEAGQHFVLDQAGAMTILKGKVVTYIVGSVLDIDKILKGKKFKGTRIGG